jgi:crotonobetainyl-CoA:carnitine CoA-transferase CaiB-like acyl-CoA transferase
MGDLLASDHLKARGFFAVIDQPGLDEPLKVPGAPYLFSRTPWSIRRPAPRLGENNDEVLGADLGLSATEIAALRESHVV